MPENPPPGNAQPAPVCLGTWPTPVEPAPRLAAASDGRIGHRDRTVFLHTGGLPGRFGHPALPQLAQINR